MTPAVDRNQFVTQMIFNFSAAVLPQLVQRREFTELKDFNDEIFAAIEDAWSRYEALTRDSVNLTVAGPMAQFPNQMPRR